MTLIPTLACQLSSTPRDLPGLGRLMNSRFFNSTISNYFNEKREKAKVCADSHLKTGNKGSDAVEGI